MGVVTEQKGGCDHRSIGWVWSQNRRVGVIIELLGGCGHRAVGWVGMIIYL